jgi:hypothetical protein
LKLVFWERLQLLGCVPLLKEGSSEIIGIREAIQRFQGAEIFLLLSPTD